jgi:hypothetical protein
MKSKIAIYGAGVAGATLAKRSAWLNQKVKAETMLVPMYRKKLGLPA